MARGFLRWRDGRFRSGNWPKRFAAPKLCRSTQRMKRLLPKYSRSSNPISWFCAGAHFRPPHRCMAALSRPLPACTSVILISSGAALAGSPNSGGYAGAKRTQIFIANYSQKESDRLCLGLRFLVLAPRIMPDTELGKHAVEGYSRYLGISSGDFIQSMASPPTSSDVATAVIELATNPDRSKGKVFIVTGKGLEVVPG